MNAKSLFVIGSMALMGAAFTSCSKEIAFDNEAVVKQQIAEYQANFIKKYGAIDPNQTWDFSDTTAYSCLSGTSASTRSANSGSMVITRSEGELIVGETFLNWVHSNLKAGNNNASKGEPFQAVIPDHDFTIIPVFQGNATYYWELWMHIGNELDGEEQIDEKIWSKGDQLTYQVENDDTWYSAGTGREGTVGAVAVKGPSFTFAGEDMPVGRALSFYLLVWDSKDAYDKDTDKSKGRTLSSIDKQMLSLKVDKNYIPQNLPGGQIVHVIGCEDKAKGDSDYEDLVFLTDGLDINKVKEVTRKRTKRYMIEDLGSKDDFDFNDVVVDLSDVWIEDIELEVNEKGGWTEKSRTKREGSEHQEAIIRAMGGTINFQLFIGGKKIWEKKGNYEIKEMLNTGVNNQKINRYAKFAEIKNKDEQGNELWSWDKDNNNISVIVEEQGSDDVIVIKKDIKFPKQGEVPMIIATRTHKFGAVYPWMKERQSIPEEWFFVPGQE